MFASNQAYLVLININTKYLIVQPIDNNRKTSIIKTIDDIVNNTCIEIETIKCDGERAFVSKIFKDYCNGVKLIHETNERRYARYIADYSFQSPNKIKLIINDSPFANVHKCVDAVIRTLRNAFGLSSQRMAKLKTDEANG